jgi:phosphonate ABC transporter permease subunit PhnE
VATLAPNCASTTQDRLNLKGEGFANNVDGAVLWFPVGAQTRRTVTDFRTDNEGKFEVDFTMPDIREDEEPQRLEIVEVVDRKLTGPSETTRQTLDKIAETILMALMASTLGTLLAVPISFLGARNMMASVGSPLAAIMAAIIAAAFGAVVAWYVTGLLVGLSEFAGDQPLLGLGVFVFSCALIWLVLRIGRPLFGEEEPSLGLRIIYWIKIIVAVVVSIFALAVLAQLGIVAGLWLAENLGPFSFVGNFIYVMFDILRVFLPMLVGFIFALVVASYASQHGQEAVLKLAEGPARLVTVILTTIGTALLVFVIAYFVNWICLFGLCHLLPQETSDLLLTLGIASLFVGFVVGLLSLRTKPKRLFPVGMVTYTITRTTLNGLRAIEPVLLGFVFVVWVGIGPLAGVLALMLSSIADLGKLFSEQVENIEEGPVEAVTATGASKLQVIYYAVVPQVVPQYLAFIFYRWDINVRLSTIIGFVGGGGIGLILFRSANLLQYRQAAVMIIAIAVVVTLLDAVSSYIRKRII